MGEKPDFIKPLPVPPRVDHGYLRGVAVPEKKVKRKHILEAMEKYLATPLPRGGVVGLSEDALVADMLALKMINYANTGDDPSLQLRYMQEIMNRLYGMPKQAIVGGEEGDSPVRVEHGAAREVIEAYMKRATAPSHVVIEASEVSRVEGEDGV